MRVLAITGLSGLGIESALAHPGGIHAAQHGFEHLVLAMLFVVPALVLLRRAGQHRGLRRPLRGRHRND